MSKCQSILVVEDDIPIRDAIKQVLEMEGHSVMVAGDGKSALELLKTLPKPCLILLDLMLPIMNGWEFLEQIKSNSGHMLAAIPVVITSAVGEAGMAEAKQAQGYIRKPIDIDLLLASVNKFCDHPDPKDLLAHPAL